MVTAPIVDSTPIKRPPPGGERSACETCPKPGTCCQGFPLSGASLAENFPTLLHAMVWITERTYANPDQSRMYLSLPFLPVGESQDKPSVMLWKCVDLLPDGKCGNYAHRPYGPCVLYQPGDDRMCAVHPEFEPWI